MSHYDQFRTVPIITAELKKIILEEKLIKVLDELLEEIKREHK